MADPPKPPDPPTLRVIDQYGIDVTDRIVAEFGSVESALEFAEQVRALLLAPYLDDLPPPWNERPEVTICVLAEEEIEHPGHGWCPGVPADPTPPGAQ